MSHSVCRYPVQTALCVKVVIAVIMAVGLQESFSGCATAAVMPARGKGSSTHGPISPERGPRISERHEARVKQITDNYELVQVDMSELLASLKENRRRSRREADNNGEATASSTTSSSSKTEQHPPEISFLVNVGGKELRLDLELNRNLIAPHFQLHSFEESGRRLIEHGATNCYYHGNVFGWPGESYAVISTCNGLSGFFGQKGTNKRAPKFMIEPLADEAEVNGSHWHAVFNGPEPSARNPQFNVKRSCGLHNFTTNGIDDDKNVTIHTDRYSPSRAEEESHEQRVRRQATPLESNVVELLLVADNYTYHKLQKNAGEVARVLTAEANKADKYYRELSVSIVVVGIVVFTQDNPFVLEPKERAIDIFSKYMYSYLENIFDFDHASLVTGVDNLTAAGQSWLGAVCKKFTKASYAQYVPIGLYVILVHELGHNFGLIHITSTCIKECLPNFCFMEQATGFSEPHMWSSCTKAAFPMLSQELCLKNVPASIERKPFCGDGLVEGNEDCDCGPANVCKDTCCNAATCTFRTGAQCSSLFDVCCDRQTCKPLNTTNVCRKSTGPCDLADYCTGTSSTECPNTIAQSGTECITPYGAGYCHLGVCSNRDSQCRITFGRVSTAYPKCYIHNKKGSETFNCGQFKNGTFVRCQDDDILCGTLFCHMRAPVGQGVNPEYRYQFSTPNTAVLDFVPGAFMRGSYCVYVKNAAGRTEDYVNDGSPCGDGKLCWNKKCVNKTELGSVICPASNGLGGDNCQGPATVTGGLSAGATAGLTVSLLMLAAAGVLLYVKRDKIGGVFTVQRHTWPSWRPAHSCEQRAQAEGLAAGHSSVSPSLTPQPNKKINHYATQPNLPPQSQGRQLQVQSDKSLAPQVQTQPQANTIAMQATPSHQDKGSKPGRPPLPSKAASQGPSRPPPPSKAASQGPSRPPPGRPIQPPRLETSTTSHA